MGVLELIDNLDVVELDVEVLVDALEDALELNVVLELDGDLVVDESLEEATTPRQLEVPYRSQALSDHGNSGFAGRGTAQSDRRPDAIDAHAGRRRGRRRCASNPSSLFADNEAQSTRHRTGHKKAGRIELAWRRLQRAGGDFR